MVAVGRLHWQQAATGTAWQELLYDRRRLVMIVTVDAMMHPFGVPRLGGRRQPLAPARCREGLLAWGRAGAGRAREGLGKGRRFRFAAV
jgi:hypothetical protein